MVVLAVLAISSITLSMTMGVTVIPVVGVTAVVIMTVVGVTVVVIMVVVGVTMSIAIIMVVIMSIAVIMMVIMFVAVIMVVIMSIAVIMVVIMFIAVIMVAMAMVCSIAMINQVHITEVIVGVVATMAELAMCRVAGSWGTWLDVAVAIGAEHKGLGITVVQTIVVTLAIVLALVGVGGSSISHKGEDDEDLHVEMWLQRKPVANCCCTPLGHRLTVIVSASIMCVI
jgi:hypothetical protein